LKPKHGWYFWIYGVIALVLGVVLWHNVKMMLVKEQMERYLREKYGKEFVVTKVYYVYPYLGGSLEVEGLAYAKDDPDLKFEIAKSASDNDPNTRAYAEVYIQDLWEKQKREEVKSILKSDIVWTGVSAEYQEEEIYGKTIDVAEAEYLFKDRIDLYVCYGMFINYQEYTSNIQDFKRYINGDLTKVQAENLFKLIKILKNSNYRDIKLELTYFNSKYMPLISKEPVRYLKSFISELSEQEKDIVLCQFRIENLNHIQNSEDVTRNILLKSGYLYSENED